MIANARMYSIGSGTAEAWRALFEWVAARAGVDLEVVDHPPPRPLAALWSRPDLGCAFMCGYPLARSNPRPRVLAAPVPAPAAYGHAPVYWSDIVVRADSPIRSLDDLFGRRFAYTAEDSQSGYQAPRRLFAPSAGAHGGRLFAATVGPLVTPRRVVDAVLAGEADGGPLDSYAHDLIRTHEPMLAAGLRVIASTPTTPIPPLVAAATVAEADAQRIAAALLDAGAAAALAAVRAHLLLDGFAPRSAHDYDILLDFAAEADRFGYTSLA